MPAENLFIHQGSGNDIHESVVVIGDVEIGSRNYLGPGTMLVGPLVLGDDNWIVAASVGFPPEHTGWYSGPRAHGIGVRIGDRTILREYVTIHSGYETETIIGDGCFLMTKTHIGHDVVLGEGVTCSPAVMVGGHDIVGARSTIGMNSVLHQRLTIGSGVMIGMNSTVTADIPDYALSYGSPARIRGANKVGLERMGWSAEQISQRVAELTAPKN